MKKGIIITAAAVVLTSALCAQAPEIEWQNTIGGSGNDQLSSIQQTNDGGYILGGESSSGVSGDKSEVSLGVSDYWVVKLNNSNEIEWQNTIGGNYIDDLRSIEQTTDGGFFVGGESSSGISGDKAEGCIGVFDYWVVKLNGSGEIEWQNTIGGSGVDRLLSTHQTADGGYIIGGYSNSGISGDKTEPLVGGYDYWVVKLNSSGIIEWQNTIGGTGDDYLSSIEQTADGGYVVGGFSGSGISGDKAEALLGAYDYWVVKLNSSGLIEWQNTIGGSDYDYLHSIAQTADGGYILGGPSESGISGDKTEASWGIADYWVIKLDSSGEIEWQNTIGGNSDDYLNAIQQTADGGYIAVGYSESDISGDKIEACIGVVDYWVIKLNSAGAIEWQNTIGGDYYDGPYSVAQTTDDGYILGGESYSGISGDKTEASMGGADYWVVKLAAPEQPCTVPVGLESAVLSTKAKVNWEPVPEALTYRIRYRSGEAEPWQYKIAYAGKTSIVLKPLLCNTTYEWQIMSICSEVDSLHSEYSSSAWFTTWACRVGEDKDMFIVYPNPASSFITIETDLDGEKIIMVVNALGQTVQSTVTSERNFNMDLKNISAGVYFIKVEDGVNTVTRKFIKQ